LTPDFGRTVEHEVLLLGGLAAKRFLAMGGLGVAKFVLQFRNTGLERRDRPRVLNGLDAEPQQLRHGGGEGEAPRGRVIFGSVLEWLGNAGVDDVGGGHVRDLTPDLAGGKRSRPSTASRRRTWGPKVWPCSR